MDIDLLHKFYRGECSEEEARTVIAWFASGKQKEFMFEQLQAHWEGFEVQEEREFPAYNSEKVLQGIHNRIQKERQDEIEVNRFRYSSIHRHYALKVASIVLLAVFSAFIVHKFTPEPMVEKFQLITTVEVPVGEKRTIRLDDGTKVVLNSGSKISYPAQFAEGKREVTLKGEAFFEVARDTTKPFMVQTGDVVTTVLGTSFNVRAYQDEREISVAVASGKVKVQRKEEELLLSPGKSATYPGSEQKLFMQDFDANEVLSWKEETLYFKDASFKEFKTALERWYGVEISTKGGKELDWQISGTFKRQSLNSVLLTIGHVKDFSYTINGNQVEIIYNNP